jgi:hypothetical protein
MPDPADLNPYHRAGYELIPLSPPDGPGSSAGKAPCERRWRTNRPLNRELAAAHMEAGRNVGVRLRAGELVIDVDPRNFAPGVDSLATLAALVGLDPAACPAVTTGGGGRHLYLRKPPAVTLVDSLPAHPGVEFKSLGRQVVAAGSVHQTGRRYAWEDWPPLEHAPEAPPALLALAVRPPPAVEGGGMLTPEAVAECLGQLPIANFRDHDQWLAIMMACHHASGGEARAEFVQWAASDPRYAARAWETGRRWDSLRPGKGVTVRTLFRAVLDAGGRLPPEVGAEDDFIGPPAEADKQEQRAEGVSLLEQMNGEYCTVNDGGKFRVFSRQVDPVLKRECYSRHTKADFEALCMHRQVEVPGPNGRSRVTPVGEWWLKHPRHRHYRGVTCDPEGSPPEHLNLWSGWGVEPGDGDWSALRDLIGEVLCDGEEQNFRYVLDWIANMVQRPASPAEAAICFKGDLGVGKGTLGRALLRIAGRHGLPVSSPAHIVGRFNAHLRDCVFLFADEAFWGGDKQGEGALKALITEPLVSYERKGHDLEMGRNMIHVMMASNNEWVIPATLGERRFLMCEANTAKAKSDGARFERVNAQLRSGGLGAMLRDMLVRDIRGWHPRNSIPVTRALVDQIIQGLDHVGTWWYKILQEGRIPGVADWSTRIAVATQLLQDDYAETCDQTAYRGRRSIESVLGRRLDALVPGRRKFQMLVPEGSGLRTDSHGRAVHYELPSLADCRAAFEARLGTTIAWPQPDPDELLR